MKTKCSSLFGKYMTIFVGILLLTTIIAPIVALVFIGPSNFFTLNFENIHSISPLTLAFRMSFISICVGTIFISIATKIVIKPIKSLSEAAKRVAKGDFTVHIEVSDQSKDELGDLTNNFNLMVQELSNNEYLHKDFVSNVSHEFKTPISAISGYAEMLASPNLSESKRLEYANIIMRQSHRLSRLSSDLLRLSELENSQIFIQNNSFSLDEQIRDAILLLQNEWEQKNIEMDIQLDEVKFTGDKSLLFQVWVNIIGNAIRYTNDKGFITINLHYIDDKIIIVVADNGIGMTNEQQEHIFERFYRADKSRSTIGTGLGLTISKRILNIHKGEIFVQSEIGNGSKFTIKLPKP